MVVPLVCLYACTWSAFAMLHFGTAFQVTCNLQLAGNFKKFAELAQLQEEQAESITKLQQQQASAASQNVKPPNPKGSGKSKSEAPKETSQQRRQSRLKSRCCCLGTAKGSWWLRQCSGVDGAAIGVAVGVANCGPTLKCRCLSVMIAARMATAAMPARVER
jgi:hypothetical protein